MPSTLPPTSSRTIDQLIREQSLSTRAVRPDVSPGTQGARLGLRERQVIRLIGDLTAVAIPWVAGTLLSGELHTLLGGAVALACWLLAASMIDTYRSERAANLAVSVRSAILTLAIASLLYAIAVGGLHLLGAGFPTSAPTGVSYLFDIGLLVVTVTAWQAIYSNVIQKEAWRNRIAILGSDATARASARTIRQSLPRDYEVVGFIDDAHQDLAVANIDGLPVLGVATSMSDLVQKYGINKVVLASKAQFTDEVIDQLAEAKAMGAEPTTMVDLYRKVIGRLPLTDGREYRLTALLSPVESSFAVYGLAKRAMDIFFSLVALSIVAAAIPFVWLANAIESPGPLFYRQRRVGKNGKEFDIIKFRSMVVDAEQSGKAVWAQHNDRRVTRIGRLLRKTHLDEVPQCWNILKGDMSFVGPRPERPQIVATLKDQIRWYNARHAVLPGLTGWAQVNYPYGNTIEDSLAKLEYDLYYIQNRTLAMDLTCLLRTIRSVVLLTGV